MHHPSPINFWTTCVPSTTLVLQSPEVISTCDGSPGENCEEDEKPLNFHS